MQNFFQPGYVLTLPAPYDLSSGDGAQVDRLFGVATKDALTGAPVAMLVAGVVNLTRATGVAWTVGQALYWDDTAKEVTTVEADNLPIGAAVVATASAATSGLVALSNSPGPAGLVAAFQSSEITGDGLAQSTPHGLGVTPSIVFATVTEDGGTGFDVAPGAHDATNAIFTVTTGVKYVVIAIA